MTKKKPRMMWRVTLYDMPALKEIKEKPFINGYVGYFDSEEEAADYKWKQLMRIKVQYEFFLEEPPKEYADQITIMEKEYGKEVS